MAETVLVVDDEEDLRLLLRLELEAEGYRVFEAADGAEALEILERENVAILLLDLLMPKVDGFEVLKALQKSGKLAHLRVVAVSAHANEATVRRALDTGATSYLFKPFRADELWAAIGA